MTPTEIEALGDERGWRPIESAPLDGTWVLLTGGTIDYSWDGETMPPAVVGQYVSGAAGYGDRFCWQFAWYDSGYYGEYKAPTHWMPLLTPPTA